MAYHEPVTAMTGLVPAGAMIDLATVDTVATADAYARLLDSVVATSVSVGNGSVRWHPVNPNAENARATEGDVHDDDPAGTHQVSFGVTDSVSARRLLDRRGLPHDEPVGVTDHTGLIEIGDVDVEAIDHLVFTAPCRDHALAIFGACLDLDFRLDREIGKGARQLFFRAADLVVEVVTGRTSATGDPQPCALWGVAWRSRDAAVTHRRLGDLGVPTSEVRIGRKPGTRVFTVHDRALATRTVVIDTETRHAE
ncbi:VOC family protein [Gordonia sp. DT101]|uniref:VOC family protein n=1 Tax=Gordonia sp. DT101 TaxID=3416545 RepID=UPI003CF9C453